MDTILEVKFGKKMAKAISLAVEWSSGFSIYPSPAVDLNCAQALMAAMFHSLVREDIRALSEYLKAQNQVPHLSSSFLRTWMRDDFHFKRQDVCRSLSSLARAVVEEGISLQSPIVCAVTGIEDKYKLKGYFTQSIILWSQNPCPATTQAVPDNPRKPQTAKEDSEKLEAMLEPTDTAVSLTSKRKIVETEITEPHEKIRRESNCNVPKEASEVKDGSATKTCDEYLATVKRYLNISKVNDLIRAPDFLGFQAIHRASWEGNAEVVEALVRLGADPNAKAVRGYTPLNLATRSCLTDTVKVLLKHGANTESRCNFGWTALHIAAAFGFTELVEVLLAAGADVDALDNDGYTPIDRALLGDLKEIVAMFEGKLAQDQEGPKTQPHGMAQYAEDLMEECNEKALNKIIELARDQSR